MVPAQENDNNNQNANIRPGAPRGALCEWLAMAWAGDSEDEYDDDDDDYDEPWWNAFTMTHGALSETTHSPVAKSYGQATGTLYDIKTFLESNVWDTPGNVIYTSTSGCIPNFIFQMLPLRMERSFKSEYSTLRFDFMGDVTDDQWTQFFAPYGLEFSGQGNWVE